MMKTTVLSADGKLKTQTNASLAETYNYADSQAEGCANLKNAVSDLLYGIDIDGYSALSMEGIAACCDIIGGVSINLERDLSYIDPEWKEGERVLLQGDAALTWISRHDAEHDPNDKMLLQRQLAYAAALFRKMSSYSPDALLERSMNIVSGVETDYSLEQTASFLDKLMRSESIDSVAIPRFANEDAYYSDLEKLEQLSREMFYIEVTEQDHE